MKFKSLFCLFLYLFLFNPILARKDTNRIKKGRLILVSSSLGAALSGAYLYIENAWWADNSTSFSFDDGSDLTYALNVDKCGHFIGGMLASDIFSSSLRWSGLGTSKSIWYGAILGSGLQLAIEIKDAYAPYWGFSKWDLTIGSIGSFWPVAQYYNSNLNAIDFKLSYYKHSNSYWILDEQRGKETNRYAWQDDYPNQTYWMTFDINHFTQLSYWPEWLNLAIGFGIDDTQFLDAQGSKTGGNHEWYISFDYDISKTLKNWDTPKAKKIKHWLNYFHFPAPAIRISPKLEFYPLFI